MKKGRKEFHKLRGLEVDELFAKRLYTCGYSRNLKVNKTQTIIHSTCSLTGTSCNYHLPKRAEDCKVYKRFLKSKEDENLRRNLKGLEYWFKNIAGFKKLK